MSLEEILIKLNSNDVAKTTSRFCDNSEFYISIVEKLLTDSTFEKLGKDLEAQDVEEAFKSAHALKGIVANCGLSSLLILIVKIVDPLRSGEKQDFNSLSTVYKELLKERDNTKKILDEITKNI